MIKEAVKKNEYISREIRPIFFFFFCFPRVPWVSETRASHLEMIYFYLRRDAEFLAAPPHLRALNNKKCKVFRLSARRIRLFAKFFFPLARCAMCCDNSSDRFESSNYRCHLSRARVLPTHLFKRSKIRGGHLSLRWCDRRFFRTTSDNKKNEGDSRAIFTRRGIFPCSETVKKKKKQMASFPLRGV